MDDSTTHIRTIMAGVREFARNTAPGDGPGIGPLTVAFMEWCDDTPRLRRTWAAPMAETLLTLHAIANSNKDVQVIQHCLQAMIRSGRFGRILAARSILARAVPLRKLAVKISLWPARDRLAITHEMLSDYPGDNDKESLAWLESVLKPLMAADPLELAPFVMELGERGETLSFPVKQAITGGLFGRWVNTRLSNGTRGDELRQLSAIIRGLGDAAYAEALAKSMELKRTTPDIHSLRAITAVGEAGNKTIMGVLLKTLSNAANGLAGACLDGIIAQDHPGAGKLLASIRTRMPDLKNAALSRAPLLGDIGYVQYIRNLPEKEQVAAHLEMHAALEVIAPDFVRNISQKELALDKCAPLVEKKQPLPAGRKEAAECPTPGFFSRIFKPKPKTLETQLSKSRNIRDMELTCSTLENDKLDGRELTSLNLAGSLFTNTSFIRTRITDTGLVNAVFSDCTITGSTFSRVDFSNAEISKTIFHKCSFNDCTFTDTLLTNCEFTECRFRACLAGNTRFSSVRMRMCGFTASSLAGSQFDDCSIRTTRFEASDLTFTELTGCDFRGVEFNGSALHAVYIKDCSLLTLDMPGTTLTRSVIKNSDAAHPLFLANRIRQMTLFAREVEKTGLPGTGETDAFLAQKVMTAWSRELTFMRRERHMLDNNRQRMTRALGSMTRDQQNFLRMLPLLLDTDAFEQKFSVGPTPSCRVWDYHPGQTPLELARHYFGNYPERDSSPDVRILAVYAMGSLGTVAQTAQSDLDCWVCYDGDLTIAMENGLKHKLEAIGLWAENEFGLEAHFFPMRMDDVRDNRFMSGNEESSGSAQALLLKEEFYRTALRLAGKNIAWWATPAGASKKHYDACIRAARRYPLAGKPRLEDFGYLAPVPADEYFGGSLWQMVKAVHSPFKSVLKLGLLETYAAPEASHLPLCDRIKRNLIRNRQGKMDTDPYTALFSTLHAYYLERKQANAAALLKESFRLKANLADIPFFMNLPARPEDESLISVLFGNGYVEPDRIANVNRPWPFDKSLKMGASVRQYMVETYQRIQSGLTGTTKALINAEDLTRMGRRIGANFSKKKHKIMRVPFMDSRNTGFPLLHFSAEKAPGKPPVWIVRGGSADEANRSVDTLQPLHRTPDPIHMLAWLLANRIYHPKSLLQADRTIAPIAVHDLQKVMRTLYDFFPFDETFERDINEGLQHERVIRAFFILNPAIPHETKIVEQAAVIYTTNWGEMFCRTFQRPGQMLETKPSVFLAQKLEQPVPVPPEMGLFIPKRAQVKRISLV